MYRTIVDHQFETGHRVELLQDQENKIILKYYGDCHNGAVSSRTFERHQDLEAFQVYGEWLRHAAEQAGELDCWQNFV